jgi:hypothetical protein
MLCHAIAVAIAYFGFSSFALLVALAGETKSICRIVWDAPPSTSSMFELHRLHDSKCTF